MTHYGIATYRYDLPPELIAQEAIHPHHDARLMVYAKDEDRIIHEGTFLDLAKMLDDSRVIFFNNSRVLPARIPLKEKKIEKSTGETGIIKDGEILFCQKLPSGDFEALVRPGTKFRIGTKIHFPGGYIEVIAMSDTGRILRAEGVSIDSIMEQYGELPLPPYIAYTKEKEEDYQTSFAKNNGSVAAPTASLHFTQELLEQIQSPKAYVTLHVGLGTFKGIDVEDIREYHIHRETIEVERDIFTKIADYKNAGKKVIGVGTTVCRTLESLPSLWMKMDEISKSHYTENIRHYWDNLTQELEDHSWIHTISQEKESILFETSIYITPGYRFRVIDELITNFHLPESSLLVLVSAFIGQTEVMQLYDYAIQERYRFFSFGDGMYLKMSK